MLNRITVCFGALAVLSSTLVNADQEIVAFANTKSPVQEGLSSLADEKLDGIAVNHDYEILSQSSNIEFRVDSPIGVISASFQNFAGSFSISGTETHKKSADIRVEAESLDTESSFISMMLKGESFFDVDKFPSMRFVGDSFQWVDERHAVLKGYMSIKNVTRPVSFYVEMTDGEKNSDQSGRITLKAAANIKRSEFDIFTLLPVVDDEVSLFVNIDAITNGPVTELSMAR